MANKELRNPRWNKWRLAALSITLWTLSFAFPVHAQVDQGTITGVVQDHSDADHTRRASHTD